MNKQEVQKRVLQNGKPLSLEKFTWSEKTRTFSSRENNLAINFRDLDGFTFKAGSYCTFNTGLGCTFDTGSYCTFNTGLGCTFDTGSYCTFKTSWSCTFDTGSYCTFDTGSYCTFKTGWSCTFNTNWSCTFSIWKNGYINNNAEDNVVIVRDSVAKTIYDLDTLPKQFLYLTADNVIAKDYKEFELINE